MSQIESSNTINLSQITTTPPNTNLSETAPPLRKSSYKTPARKYSKGIGDAVADRTINRKVDPETRQELPALPFGTKDTRPFDRETWEEVAKRVATGNTSLIAGSPDQEFEFETLHHHLRQASILMSGRHLQHGDETQPTRPLEAYSNCSTSATTFLLFYLLLNGSGVGRSYDDAAMVVDYNFQPIVVPVIDMGHADVQTGEINVLTSETAHHLYYHRQKTVFRVPDSREGWAKAIEQIETMTYRRRRDEVLILDFSDVRPRGAPILGMQGRPASGPGPLITAIKNIATLRESNMPAWRAAMYADHYAAECVLVGGARRAARMATKYWKDPSVMEFISVKRGGFLWSSNNSVLVDEEFWDLIKKEEKDLAFSGPEAFKDWDHAQAVFKAVTEAAYFDNTGEPGIINVDKLAWDPTGMESLEKGDYAKSERYQLDDATLELTKAIVRVWGDSKYKVITNPCVPADTPILTKDGYINIGDAVGKEVEVWNGEVFSKVVPFATGVNPTLRIEFSNGVELRCTPAHKFVLHGDRFQKEGLRVEAKSLSIGDRLAKFSLPNVKGGDDLGTERQAYSQGFYSGDGNTNLNYSWLYSPKYVCMDRLEGSFGEEHKSSSRLTWRHGVMRPKNWVPTSGNYSFVINWLAGLLDSDGSICKDMDGGESLQISSIDKQFLLGVRLLLTRIGVSASVGVMKEACIREMPDGRGKVKEYSCKECWRLVINSFDAWSLYNEGGLTTNRLVYSGKKPNRSASRFITVTQISEDAPCSTFCFTEPLSHTGTFNGIVTANCGEIVLNSLGAFCVIADVVPFHTVKDVVHKEKQDADAEDAFRTATRALIRTNTMPSMYGVEVARTNRIGVGMTGIHEYAFARFGYGWKDLIDEEKSKPFWLMLARFKRAVQDEAEKYSKKLGLNTPHTNTTQKPSGSVSKLFSLTEGAHLPAMREYLRWVQFRNDDPLVKKYKAKGYPCKELKIYSGTTIIGFPTIPAICTLGMGDKLITAAEATPEEQYQYLRLLEKYWIRGVEEDGITPLPEKGNQVSYTLKYDPAKVSFEEFQRTLKEGQSTIRCCSVMPQIDTSAYEYTPEQPVSKHEFEMIANAIQESIQADEVKEDIGLEHVDCAGGACPIDWGKNDK